MKGNYGIKERILYNHFLKKIISAISQLLPKDDNLILFYADGGYGDNPFYLYRKMKELSLSSRYKLVWLVKDTSIKRHIIRHGGIAVSFQEIFKALKYMLRAKYLITSHGPPAWKSSKQVNIDFWHGIPLKTLGQFQMYHNEYDKKGYFQFKIEKITQMIEKNTDYLVVSSQFVRVLFSSVFRIPPEKILVLGQPRCDALFKDKKVALEELEKVLNRKLNFDRIILYAPTYREYDHNVTTDIIKELITSEKFNNYLKQNKLLFLILPHPFDYELLRSFESTHIILLDRKRFLEHNIEIYDILPAVDILITDYSSIYFDYLLLNRPIIFYIPDFKKYKEERGFLLEPYERWTPGDKARTIEELITAIKEAIENPKKWEKERLWLRDIMFKYKDGRSSKRVADFLLRLLEGDKKEINNK